MTEQTTTYIYIGTTLLASAIYYLTFRYQAKKIDILEKAIKTQSTLLDDFDKFKKLLDVDHYLKNRDLQLENQKIQLTRFFETEAKKMGEKIVENMSNKYVETNHELLSAFNELAQVPLSIIMKQYPGLADKVERDKYIVGHFPHSSELFIRFCDDYVAGKIPQSDLEK
jgi:uncharacterized membrane-anchored protein YhcB (DUF1043 family)